jgi:hypothetical protein
MSFQVERRPGIHQARIDLPDFIGKRIILDLRVGPAREANEAVATRILCTIVATVMAVNWVPNP